MNTRNDNMTNNIKVDMSPFYVGFSVKGGFDDGVLAGQHIVSNMKEYPVEIFFPPTLTNISLLHAKGIVQTIRSEIGWKVDLYAYVKFVGQPKVVSKLNEVYY